LQTRFHRFGGFVKRVCSLFCVVAAFVAAMFLTAGSSANAQTLSQSGALTAEQAAFDVRLAKRALTELHPALTKYATQAEMDAAFARFETRGNAARSATEMYLAATELAAAIRCGHTWTNTYNQNGAVKAALLDAQNKLPFEMVLVESRWLVIASATPSIKAGDEILTINGVPADEIVKRMMPYLRADGSSDGKRLIQLSHDRPATSMMDLVWPLLSPPEGGRYALRVRRANGEVESYDVAAMTFVARKAAFAAQGKGEQSEQWTLSIEGDVATMTLPTFAFWNSKFDWKQWLQASFASLRERNIKHLLIDIRANEGGDGAINRELLSYLLTNEFTWPASQAISAYERAPYILAKYLDTWDYSFFDRTGNVEKLGEKRFLIKPKSGSNTIVPRAETFRGKTYLLIGAENSSATFQLAYLVKRSGVATLIGQRTGGNLRGLNGGELTWVTLPNSGVAIDIPLLASNPIEPQPDASIEPDIAVTRTFVTRAAGRDLEMEAAMRKIAMERAK
jgi:C-terminal processing protease CtpA/Prc